MKTMPVGPAYKGVVFDLDGTLINSIEDLTDALNIVLDYYDLPPKTYAEGKQLVGKGIKNLVRFALPRKLRQIDGIVDEAYGRMMQEYERRKLNKTKPYKDIPYVLGYLNRHGVPFAVCSNKADRFVKEITDALFSDIDFAVTGGMHGEMSRKPDPEQTLECVEKMGLDPGECLYIGDSSVDYETARNAGMRPALCAWGFEGPEVKEYKDALYIDHPMRIIDAVKYGDQMYEVFPPEKE